MSKDFELLRKAELAGKVSPIVPRWKTVPEFSGLPDSTETRVRPSEHVHTRDSDWIKALGVLRKRWRLILSLVSIVLGVVSLIVFFWLTPEYEPSARLEIDPPGSETFSMESNGSPPSEMQYLETQAQNLQTDDLAIAVIRKLRLDQNPDFAAKTPMSERPADPLRLSPAESVALRSLRTRLKVLHDPNSRVISVSVPAHNPQLAADVTNTLVQTFVDRTLTMKRDAIASSRSWLEEQLNDVRAKVEQSDRDLAAFQQQTGVADIDEGRNTFGDLITDLDRQTTQAESERIQLESYLQKARAGGVDSLPQIRDNPVVQKLTQSLAEARAQLSQDLVIYGVNHPNTKKLQSQVSELEKQLTIQKKEALDQLRITYEAALARKRLMAGQKKAASKTIGDMAQYNILKKQAQSQSALYTSLLGKIEEAGIAAASRSTNIRVVDPARILDRPSRPHRVRDLAFGLLAGLLGGITLAFLRERVDRPLRTPQDVREWAGVPSVAIIPAFVRNGVRRGIESHPKHFPMDGPGKFLLERPNSPESEAVRSLHADVILSHGEQPQVVLVTSSIPGEGKTTVAMNLALALSQHRTTCLVDADLRRPGVARGFGVFADKSLGDVLLGSVHLEDALVTMKDCLNLAILPGGEASDERAHLISSTAMTSLMESLRNRFEFIVLDSPPIIPYVDGRVLSTLSDSIIFVTRSGITPGPAMIRSMELLEELKSPRIVKVVLNAHDFSGQGFYSYRY
jgi:succinoglycan biosynthesis transport protein ExoP